MVTSHIHPSQYQNLTRRQSVDRGLNSTPKETDFRNNWAQQSYRRPAPRHGNRYQSFFPGYCYSCYKLGHKAVACRSKPVKMFSQKRVNESIRKQSIPDNFQFERKNHFEALSTEKECLKCNNFGHPTEKCKSNWTPFTKGTDYHHEGCSIALQA